MRPKILILFALVALVAVGVFAVERSPNFSLSSTNVVVLTSDHHGYRFITVPVPYREPIRIVQAPVAGTEIGTAWPDVVAEHGLPVSLTFVRPR